MGTLSTWIRNRLQLWHVLVVGFFVLLAAIPQETLNSITTSLVPIIGIGIIIGFVLVAIFGVRWQIRTLLRLLGLGDKE